MYRALRKYCHGHVLDVGGRDFVLTVLAMRIPFETWTTLDVATDGSLQIDDQRVRFITGDGCRMDLPGDQFDTVLNIQVLEHVLEPLEMVREISRVLKPSGYGIFLIPQTSTLHMAPFHYYNFTRYWILETMKRTGLQIVELNALGGRWSSTASHLVYFFLQCARFPGMFNPDSRKGILFFALFPLMVLYALVSIPICLLLSIADLKEEPNNHLVVVQKPLVQDPASD